MLGLEMEEEAVLTDDRAMSAVATLERGLGRVLACGDPAVERLRRARASVAFCGATTGEALTLDLRADGNVSLHDGDRADIRIAMDDAWLRCFAAGPTRLVGTRRRVLRLDRDDQRAADQGDPRAVPRSGDRRLLMTRTRQGMDQ